MWDKGLVVKSNEFSTLEKHFKNAQDPLTQVETGKREIDQMDTNDKEKVFKFKRFCVIGIISVNVISTYSNQVILYLCTLKGDCKRFDVLLLDISHWIELSKLGSIN